MMHDREKSHSAIGAGKPTNKAGSPAAESVEQRAGTKRNVSSAGRSQLATGTGPAAREGPSYCHGYASSPDSGDNRNQQSSILSSVFPRTSSVGVYRGTQPDRGAISRRATDGGVGT